MPRPSLMLLLSILIASLEGAMPASPLYPFPGYDLVAVRRKTLAESLPDSPDLIEAWALYRELRGSWMPDAPKPKAASIARLDELKHRIESLPQPAWYTEAIAPSASGRVKLADEIGDALFEKQKATPDYLSLKALAIVHLTEHELDRAEAAQKARAILAVLIFTHPWDWDLHGLNSRVLLDAQLFAEAWGAARQSLYLNPRPGLGDLRYFAYIGSITAKGKWEDVQEVMREACPDPVIAEQAIKESALLYSAKVKVNVVQPKK